MFDLFERLRTIGKVLRHLARARHPHAGARARRPEQGRVWNGAGPTGPRCTTCFANPIYAGVYVYGLRPIDRRRQKPGRPGTGRRPPHLDNAAVVLPDRVPAYISWEQYQRNQAQLQANRAGWAGPVRAGSALLSGAADLRPLRAAHDARTTTTTASAARYTVRRHEVELCRAALPVPQGGSARRAADRGWCWRRCSRRRWRRAWRSPPISMPSAPPLERHWQQRLERARYEVDRARRQYGAVEPENRLVARTLEKAWEEALAEQARLEADYERFRREPPPGAEPGRPRHDPRPDAGSAGSLAAPDDDPGGAPDHRPPAARTGAGRSGRWHGAGPCRVPLAWREPDRHQLVRPVARLDALSTYPDLVARAAGLHREGHGYPEIAEILNHEGWRPAKRRDTFNAAMVNHLLLRAGIVERRYPRGPRPIEREPDEWTIRELAEEIGMPQPTLYTWVQQGRLPCRLVKAGGKPAKLVHADAADIAALKEIRAVPAPWHRRPPVLPSPYLHLI